MPASSVTSSDTSSSSDSSSVTSSSSYQSDNSTAHTANNFSPNYWSTEQILARNASRSAQISAPPNSSMAFEPRRPFSTFVSLGPIIGMVTESTARILIEVSQTCDVKCFLTDKFGVQHGALKRCVRGVPNVFQLEELRANTYYKISFDIPVPGIVKTGVKTLPANWNVKKHPARIAVVSSNDFIASRDHISSKADLWKALYNQCKNQEVDYVFHLGNIVFIDSDEYSANGEYQGSKEHPCAYQEALAYCRDLDGEQLMEAEKRVCEIFRNVYRDAWSFPSTRHVMANAPNLMILADHEIVHGLGEVDSAQRDTTENFLQYCAYRVYNEYCRALFEDLPPIKKGGSISGALKIGQAYHFHAFGDIGFLFLDIRAQRTLHRDWSAEDLTNFLGTKQWDDFDYAISDGGYLHNCKVLLVCTSSPICELGDPSFFTSSNSISKLSGSWNSPNGIAEASMLLRRLFDWKAQRPGRKEFILLAGSRSDGGMTEIVDLRYRAQNNSKSERVKQIVSGPIAVSHVDWSKPSLYSAGSRIKWLAADNQFKHLDIIAGPCSFALVDVENAHGLLIKTQHVFSQGKRIVAKVQSDSSMRAGGWWSDKPARTQ